ncbi:MAG: PilZ domain-containing protein [Candidatus Omnitrophota bacterium]
MEERRHLTRWQINKDCKIKLEGAYVYADAQVRDINFKGGSIALKKHLVLDKFLKMHIMISEGFIIEAELWILWQKRVLDSTVYGFCFKTLKDHDKERLYQFILKQYSGQLNRQWWRDDVKKGGGTVMREEGFDDKRTFERFSVNLSLKLLALDSNKEDGAEVQDISAKGLGLMTRDWYPPHTPLEMWLSVPDQGQPLYTRGSVAWSNLEGPDNFRTGVELEKADLMGVSRVLRAV